ncbi:hypothetical protein M426DRAFT_321800 [Hypoxylon sp. CI-4A]|nr:hypothetical protein M426DRAFT_321800 [Hypoxylon sp. CI-4A]
MESNVSDAGSGESPPNVNSLIEEITKKMGWALKLADETAPGNRQQRGPPLGDYLNNLRTLLSALEREWKTAIQSARDEQATAVATKAQLEADVSSRHASDEEEKAANHDRVQLLGRYQDALNNLDANMMSRLDQIKHMQLLTEQVHNAVNAFNAYSDTVELWIKKEVGAIQKDISSLNATKLVSEDSMRESFSFVPEESAIRAIVSEVVQEKLTNISSKDDVKNAGIDAVTKALETVPTKAEWAESVQSVKNDLAKSLDDIASTISYMATIEEVEKAASNAVANGLSTVSSKSDVEEAAAALMKALESSPSQEDIGDAISNAIAAALEDAPSKDDVSATSRAVADSIAGLASKQDAQALSSHLAVRTNQKYRAHDARARTLKRDLAKLSNDMQGLAALIHASLSLIPTTGDVAQYTTSLSEMIGQGLDTIETSERWHKVADRVYDKLKGTLEEVIQVLTNIAQDVKEGQSAEPEVSSANLLTSISEKVDVGNNAMLSKMEELMNSYSNSLEGVHKQASRELLDEYAEKLQDAHKQANKELLESYLEKSQDAYKRANQELMEGLDKKLNLTSRQQEDLQHRDSTIRDLEEKLDKFKGKQPAGDSQQAEGSSGKRKFPMPWRETMDDVTTFLGTIDVGLDNSAVTDPSHTLTLHQVVMRLLDLSSNMEEGVAIANLNDWISHIKVDEWYCLHDVIRLDSKTPLNSSGFCTKHANCLQAKHPAKSKSKTSVIIRYLRR